MEALKRRFKFKDFLLDDPNPIWGEKKVLEYYTNLYPEMLNSNVRQGEEENGFIVFTIDQKVGTKG